MNSGKESVFRRLFPNFFKASTPPPPISKARQREYRVAVEKLANTHENRRFLNGEEWHAEIVGGLMVGQISEPSEVLIYSDSLAPEFYAKALASLKCRCRVIVGNTAALGVIRSLPKEVQSRIDCRASNDNKGAHFLVADDAFRYQLDGSSDELQVVCNFYEPETAERLRGRFETMWEKATPWPVH